MAKKSAAASAAEYLARAEASGTAAGAKPGVGHKPIDNDGAAAFLTGANPVALRPFTVWLVGETPLITHAWSEKAKREMLQKHTKETKAGKGVRDPEAEFTASLYNMPDGSFGFPVTAIKNAMLSVAHRDKGVAKTDVRGALYLDAKMIRVAPALAGAICDMPLVQIYGSDPEMREDMVKIGAGLNKVASLAYRAQFTNWAIRITGRFNEAVISLPQVAFLINLAGTSCGIGEWRVEKKGVFGSFRLSTVEEERAWEAYSKGVGPLPPLAWQQNAA